MHYICTGSTFRIANEEDIQVYDRLPAGNYYVAADPMGNLFLEKSSGFVKPKIYGDVETRVDRIVNTYMDRENNTGVLLQGEKGSGKTLLAKLVSIRLAEMGIPTIVVNNGMCGENFNKFIESIDQPCAIMFDEFEKLYDMDDQNKMLTLFDGSVRGKKLYLVTVNDKFGVSRHMKNRPGRFYYRFEYQGLDQSFIVDYAKQNLKNQDHIEGLVSVASSFYSFNFDMLKAIVEEMNRYNEKPAEVLQYVNADPENDSNQYKVISVKLSDDILKHKGELEHDKVSDGQYVNLFQHGGYIDIKYPDEMYDDDDIDLDMVIYFDHKDIVAIQGEKITFRKKGTEFVVKKHVDVSKKYYEYML